MRSILLGLLVVAPVGAQLPPLPRVWNLHIAGDEELLVDGSRLAFIAVESDQGADLNADGDQADHVMFLYDGGKDQLTNLGLAVSRFGPDFDLDGDHLALGVDEQDQGADLNGDGDLYDTVLHLVDAASGAITNTQLDVFGPLPVAAGRVACGVNESSVDLNADGDTNDVVVHLIEFGGATLNLGWASFEWALGGELLAVPVQEIYQGDTDLNGDGDAWDAVLFVHDIAAGTSMNTGLSVYSPTGQIPTQGGRVVFAVEELASGGQDLNGDGDAQDAVLHIYEAGVIQNRRLAMAGGVRVDGEWALISVPEASQGGADRNGDGDVLDQVLAAVPLGGGAALNLGLAAPTSGPYVQLAGGWVACDVLESDQGATDLNGDGDAIDVVLHVIELGGATRNLGLATGSGSFSRLSSSLCATSVSEFHHGGVDLNGDGDVQDVVMHVHDLATGVTANLGYHSSSYTLRGDRLAFAVTENSQGATDLNKDGDAGDLVEFLYLGRARRLIDLELATWNQRAFGEQGLFAFGVREDSQGSTDLNGDGDSLDQVLHVLR